MTRPGLIDTTSTSTTGFALHRRVLTALAAVSILGATGCAGAEAPAAAQADDEAAAATDTAPGTTAEAAPGGGSSPAAGGQAYEDGTYEQTGTYQSPAGEEEVGVSMTLTADVVTAVEVTPMPDNPTTEIYQGRFAGGISEAVVGKRLDELTVDKVAGSSLTSGGFNDAASKIKSEARL